MIKGVWSFDLGLGFVVVVVVVLSMTKRIFKL